MAAKQHLLLNQLQNEGQGCASSFSKELSSGPQFLGHLEL